MPCSVPTPERSDAAAPEAQQAIRGALIASLDRLLSECRLQIQLLDAARARLLAGDDDGARQLLVELNARIDGMLAVDPARVSA